MQDIRPEKLYNFREEPERGVFCVDVEKLLKELTVEEKAALVSGTDFMYTNAVPRLKIPALRTSDGPHGLRVQTEGGDNGVTGSLPATAFPTAATTACGWDEENLTRIGEAMGRECRKYGVHVLLGPAVNIKRNPTAGRNFEYFSEDPYLAGKLAAAQIRGIQSQGVGVSVKHFALNNAENFRFMGDSVADLRAMREIYLKVFEIAVREGKPATVMCAYNKINGTYCSQNGWLLNEVLCGEWGFDGLVMTDWGAMHDRVASLKAGLDLEMPGDTRICRRWILDGIADGSLDPADLDRAAGRVLRAVDRYVKEYPDEADFATHNELARRVAGDCAVLLKNDGLLPLAEGEELCVLGDLFTRMRYQGAGSSMINPAMLSTPEKAFDERGIRYRFARGYAENGEAGEALIREALALAEGFEKVVVFAGLTDAAESEGCDRADMKLPENQLALLEALGKTGKKIAVVLFGGSPVELPFAERVSAILDMYLPGQSGGAACADLLFGRVSPSGRLAETWPERYEDVPSAAAFGKGPNEIYRDSVFVGYRYYATAGRRVRYPFGYGLSYTKFSYSDFRAEREGEGIRVGCRVTNAGAVPGAEVVQVYAGLPDSGVFRPRRELKAFRKVRLRPGESAEVTLRIPLSQLAFFDPVRKTWQTEGGRYRIELCRDALTPIWGQDLEIEGERAAIYPPEVLAVYREAKLEGVTDAIFERMSGQKIPPLPPRKPITLESRFTDLRQTLMGRILFSAVLSVAKKQFKRARRLPEGPERDNKLKGALFLKRILESNSVVSMSMSAGESMPYNFAEGFVALANGHLLKGIRCFCKKIKVPALPKEKKE